MAPLAWSHPLPHTTNMLMTHDVSQQGAPRRQHINLLKVHTMISIELSNSAQIILRGTDTLVTMVGDDYLKHLMDEVGFLNDKLDKYTGKLNQWETEKLLRSIIRSRGVGEVQEAIRDHEEDALI